MGKVISLYLSDDKTHYKRLYKEDLNENGYCDLKYDELDRKEYKVSGDMRILMNAFEHCSLDYSRVSLMYDMLRAKVIRKYNLSESDFEKILQETL